MGLLDIFGGGDPNAVNQTYGVPQGIVDRSNYDAMMNMGALLFAAGQKLTPEQRAAYLAQMPNAVRSRDTSLYNQSQARLMGVRAQEEEAQSRKAAQQEAAMNGFLSDPEKLRAAGIQNPGAILALPVGLREKAVAAGLAPRSTATHVIGGALVDNDGNVRYQSPERPQTTPTPQMVDLPGGGKGWATPGSPDITPIGGAGKGGVDTESAKRSDDEKKNLTYAKEAIAAHRILSDPTYSGDLTSGYKSRVNMIPTLNGSWAGEKYMTGDAQANSFVDSVVRPRSGAVIGKKEEADKKLLFTPMPGDSQDRLFAKGRMRAQHIQSLIAGANPADRPMLQNMYEDTISELQKMTEGYQGNGKAGGQPQNSLPNGVRSIRRID